MLFWAILLLALPFVLPIVSLVRSSRTRADLRMLERTVANQEELITKLAQQLGELRRTARPEPPPAPVVPTPAPRRVSTSAPPVVPTPMPEPALLDLNIFALPGTAVFAGAFLSAILFGMPLTISLSPRINAS